MSAILAIYEGFFSFLGLANPLKRLLFGTAIGFSLQLIVKPKISYREDGTAKKFGETLFPWYVLALIPGVIFALFF